VNGQSAAPLGGTRGQRQIDGNTSNCSALVSVRNALVARPRSYDDLQFAVREVRPRLVPEAVDHALARLIQHRIVKLGDDCRWTARL
jgi:hypothetical protein